MVKAMEGSFIQNFQVWAQVDRWEDWWLVQRAISIVLSRPQVPSVWHRSLKGIMEGVNQTAMTLILLGGGTRAPHRCNR